MREKKGKKWEQGAKPPCCERERKKSSPGGKKSLPGGKNSSLGGEKSAPGGKKSAPVGKKSSPVGKKSYLLGEEEEKKFAKFVRVNQIF